MGGVTITGIFGRFLPRGLTLRTDGRFWKSGAGAPASQVGRLPLTSCPLPCHFWATNWKRRKVLGSQQPDGPLASNDPVPSTLPSPKPGRFSRPAAAGHTTTTWRAIGLPLAPGRGNAAGHGVPKAGLPPRAGRPLSHRPGVWGQAATPRRRRFPTQLGHGQERSNLQRGH